MFAELTSVVIVGYILLIYGILKVAFCIILLALPEKYRGNSAFFKRDPTAAGTILDIVLFLFGVYTILHGSAMIRKSRHTHIDLIEHIYTIIALYGSLGIFMIVFYTLVVYTNAPISKDKTEMSKYELVGIGGGIGFLTALFAMLLWNAGRGYMFGSMVAFDGDTILWSLLFGLGLVAFACLCKNVLKKEGITSKRKEIVTLTMLPLGTIN